MPERGESPSYGFTLEGLDELAGGVAAEADYAEDKKLQKELWALHARILEVLESNTDQDG